MRSNPIARILKKHQKLAKLSIVGPHRYISPDWYGVIDQVPTLNYVAAHIGGTLRIGEREDLRALLDRLSTHFEEQLAPKPAWRTSKVTPDILDKMLRQIIPCELKIEDIQSAWKLNQNKTDVVRLAAADAVAQYVVETETRALAALMRVAGGNAPGQ